MEIMPHLFIRLCLKAEARLHLLVEGPADNLFLLLTGELVEVYSIAGHSDCEVGIKLGIIHSINKLLSFKDIDIDVVSALVKVSVKNRNQV